MRKTATILAVAALGAVMAVGSATETMARGHGGRGGGHEFFRSHGFHGGHHFGGFHGNRGHFNHYGYHNRGHFRDFRRFESHDYYWGNPYYSCGFPFLFGGGYPYCR
ncbi:hypothetical protein [Candidatus Phyllobacterium onerii]|uniref:hypothetical protein n=1 Tax=Candidatus Phyllobacterium onerii TaxID=3020828 RepID=UPI00233111BB|nr:hypothetical protein [Phyllobacterium sp. IY22]